jgi:RNA polymerase sigma-70 factor (ECF subfamily)
MCRHQTDTEELIRRAREGDQSAVENLMQRHRKRLRQMIRTRMDPRVVARVDPSDVVQDVLAAAYRGLPRYLESCPIPFYPWLRRIAWQKLVHCHEQHLHATKRSVTREQRGCWGLSDYSAVQLTRAINGRSNSPSKAATRREIHERVQAALDEITKQDREVLLQRYLEQLSAKEIAAVLDTTESAVHMRHMRALRKVHRLLMEDEI